VLLLFDCHPERSMTVLYLTAALWQGDRVPLIVTGGGR